MFVKNWLCFDILRNRSWRLHALGIGLILSSLASQLVYNEITAYIFCAVFSVCIFIMSVVGCKKLYVPKVEFNGKDLLFGFFYTNIAFVILYLVCESSFLDSNFISAKRVQRVDSLHFFLSTLSTTGYGNIIPADSFMKYLNGLHQFYLMFSIGGLGFRAASKIITDGPPDDINDPNGNRSGNGPNLGEDINEIKADLADLQEMFDKILRYYSFQEIDREKSSYEKHNMWDMKIYFELRHIRFLLARINRKLRK